MAKPTITQPPKWQQGGQYQQHMPGGGYQQWAADPRGKDYGWYMQYETGGTPSAQPSGGGGGSRTRTLPRLRGGGGSASATGPKLPTKTTTTIGPSTVTQKPGDEALYEKYIGAIDKYEAGGISDLSAAREGIADELRMKSTAGMQGSDSPMARAAQNQAMVPYYNQMALMEQDRINTFYSQLFNAFNQAAGLWTTQESSGRTDTTVTEEGQQFATDKEKTFLGYGPRGQGMYG